MNLFKFSVRRFANYPHWSWKYGIKTLICRDKDHEDKTLELKFREIFTMGFGDTNDQIPLKMLLPLHAVSAQASPMFRVMGLNHIVLAPPYCLVISCVHKLTLPMNKSPSCIHNILNFSFSNLRNAFSSVI